VESQAIARALRIGQDQEVRVTKYIITGSVEEDMVKQQKAKEVLAQIGDRKLDEERNATEEDDVCDSPAGADASSSTAQVEESNASAQADRRSSVSTTASSNSTGSMV